MYSTLGAHEARGRRRRAVSGCERGARRPQQAVGADALREHSRRRHGRRRAAGGRHATQRAVYARSGPYGAPAGGPTRARCPQTIPRPAAAGPRAGRQALRGHTLPKHAARGQTPVTLTWLPLLLMPGPDDLVRLGSVDRRLYARRAALWALGQALTTLSGHEGTSRAAGGRGANCGAARRPTVAWQLAASTVSARPDATPPRLCSASYTCSFKATSHQHSFSLWTQPHHASTATQPDRRSAARRTTTTTSRAVAWFPRRQQPHRA